MFVVLLGGVRSGKSRLAVELASRAQAPVTFVATAEAGDGEMTARIDAHRNERPSRWETVEAPLEVVGAIEIVPGDHFVVVDCVTVWVSNLMHVGTSDDDIVGAARRLGDTLRARSAGAVCVTNEVGMGVHPSSELGRHYRDLLGAVNVGLAAVAERALLIVAGRAVALGDPWELLR